MATVGVVERERSEICLPKLGGPSSILILTFTVGECNVLPTELVMHSTKSECEDESFYFVMTVFFNHSFLTCRSRHRMNQIQPSASHST
ncbi:unnamed protein product [Lathyrus oleraceus]